MTVATENIIQPIDFKNYSILIIDDNHYNLKMSADCLKMYGFKIEMAINGEIGLQKVRKFQPDIILLDVMMPGIDGFETCRCLKTDESTKDIPVIFMTGQTNIQDKLKGFEMGAVDYVTKPVQYEELLARVSTHLKIRYLTHHLQEKNHAIFQTLTTLQETQKQLLEANNKALAANKAKSTFLANMSHELRTPLHAIIGFSQLMSKSQELSHEHQENLGIIRHSGEHLLNLVNDVLDMSKIEAGRMTFSEKNFDLYRLLDDVIDMFLLKADDKHLQLLFERRPDVPHYVRTDELKLRQVFINLLNNAIKFTQEGGISVRVARKSDGLENKAVLRFEVEDSGPGINPNELSNLFRPFVQTQTGQEIQEGSGLGLAISQQFVKLMGGELTVSSELGHGSLFKWFIQATVVSEQDIEIKQAIRHVVALEPSQIRYRILIVDDKSNNRLLLFKLLNPLGFELKEARNGQEALEIWEEWQPHLIWISMFKLVN